MKEIEIFIDKKGNTTFDVKGSKGQECNDLTKIVEDRLGIVEEKIEKAEMRIRMGQGQRQRVSR